VNLGKWLHASNEKGSEDLGPLQEVGPDTIMTPALYGGATTVSSFAGQLLQSLSDQGVCVTTTKTMDDDDNNDDNDDDKDNNDDDDNDDDDNDKDDDNDDNNNDNNDDNWSSLRQPRLPGSDAAATAATAPPPSCHSRRATVKLLPPSCCCAAATMPMHMTAAMKTQFIEYADKKKQDFVTVRQKQKETKESDLDFPGKQDVKQKQEK
jgi:hypothetical protein